MTARADTEVGVANVALGLLKQPPVAQLTDNNDRARAVKAMLATARDATLRFQHWNFATGWASPAQAAGYISLGYRKNAFPLPDDCIEVRFVEEADADDWEVAAAKVDPAGSTADVLALITNLTAPIICYTRCIQEPRLWDGEAILAWAHQLAVLAGPQLGASVARIGDLSTKTEKWKVDASKSDAREKSRSTVTRTTSWLTARRRGGATSRG